MTDQTFEGPVGQVAGNDIHNHTQVEEHKPPEDSPLLYACKACEWPGVAVNADKCGKCGFNYALERAEAAERQRRDSESRIYWAGVSILAIYVGAVALMHAVSLGFFDAIAVSFVGALIAWGGWVWLSARCSIKLDRLKKKQKG
ncbi:hypothetical protein [Marinobacter salsuginis]|uniref:hypothetical protein n=1 Tax=Marinobacter salsuginis TaxID=418719 RepID=UPI00273D9860|nr:hypothetical protein [Marinobacter salsuginis]